MIIEGLNGGGKEGMRYDQGMSWGFFEVHTFGTSRFPLKLTSRRTDL